MRMLLTMAISLYTSRIVLKVLGVEDYGVYNAVGGVVASFALVSGALSAAISRFITFELGSGDDASVRRVFASSVTIQMMLAGVVLILGEIFGLWFLNTRMDIPPGRLGAANAVLQCSIATFIVNILSIPYNAAIIAHEKMGAFAYISILDAALKLVAVWLLTVLGGDKLILYGLMLMAIQITQRIIYGIYCRHRFGECRGIRLLWDRDLLRRMFSFASWSFLGNGSYVLQTSGINLLINVFFGVVMNAARGVAVQVEFVVTSFVNNFTTALNPQIIKSYSCSDRESMFRLVFLGSRYSFFMMLVLSVPIMLHAPWLLGLWLDTVPPMAPLFVRLTLAMQLVASLSCTLITAANATGDIKRYQLIVGGLGLMVFFVSWALYAAGAPVQGCYYAAIAVFAVQLFARVALLRRMVGLDVGRYLREVVAKAVAVAAAAWICTAAVSRLPHLASFLLSLLLTALCVAFIGMDSHERRGILTLLKIRKNG